MPYHISKPNSSLKVFGVNKKMYYKGDNHWTDNYDDRKKFDTLFQVEQFYKTIGYTDNFGNTILPHGFNIGSVVLED